MFLRYMQRTKYTHRINFDTYKVTNITNGIIFPITILISHCLYNVSQTIPQTTLAITQISNAKNGIKLKLCGGYNNVLIGTGFSIHYRQIGTIVVRDYEICYSELTGIDHDYIRNLMPIELYKN